MHLAFAIRGHKHWQDRFINELSSRYLPFKMYEPQTKQLKEYILEMRVCPIQLFDVCFPAEHFDTVANTILSGSNGEPNKSSLKKYLWILRKGIGFKKLPEYKKDNKLSMSLPQDCEIFAIGVKDDYWIEPDGRKVSKEEKSDLAWEGI